MTISEWSKELGINRITLHQRINNGWRVGDALTAPHNSRIKKIKREKKSYEDRPALPDGCYWDGRYKVVCPDGKVFDHRKRAKPMYPQPTEYYCSD